MTLACRSSSLWLLNKIAALLILSSVGVLAQTASRSRVTDTIDSMPYARSIEQAAISPDGTEVAVVAGGELTIRSLRGGAPRPIEIESRLRLRDVGWSADGKQIAFLADLPGEAPAAQVWTAAADGTAQVKRAELKGYAEAVQFAPDGSRLALLFIEGMPRVAGPLQPMTPLAGVIDEKTYEQRLTTIDLRTNTLRTVTPADMYVYEYEWTPDGKNWVATAARGAGDANWYVARLYLVSAASGQMREIHHPRWQIAEPQVSPDGNCVAFIEGLMSDEGVTGGDIFVVPLAGGPARNLTPNLGSSPSSLAWSGPDRIVFAQNVDGKSGFATVSRSGGAVETIWTGEEFVGTADISSPSASFSADGLLTAVVRQSASAPPEVWAGPIAKWKQLTTFNAGLKPAWGEMRNFHWKNGSTSLEGWLMLPKDFVPGKTYPLVVNVHGGPSAACVSHWDTRAMGIASALGYFAFCPNPRGSYGQGEAFTQANVKDFGGGDYRDIMSGVDAILEQYPVDSHRMGVRGHSYGGYMTMWVETQTERFAAAVAGAGLSNWQSYYGVNDIDEWMIPFFGASVYDDPAVYAKSDPMHFVKAVKTPTLILVGDRDGEVPMEQSVEWWHALKDKQVPTRLVVYANEGHVFVNPSDARDYLVRTFEWFEEWFQKAERLVSGEAKPADGAGPAIH
ncbi:MAG TPA: S9 family peptidase [Terriglobales bacterium]|nr:S9 family peptidase [Terriglobales bacterium]